MINKNVNAGHLGLDYHVLTKFSGWILVKPDNIMHDKVQQLGKRYLLLMSKRVRSQLSGLRTIAVWKAYESEVDRRIVSIGEWPSKGHYACLLVINMGADGHEGWKQCILYQMNPIQFHLSFLLLNFRSIFWIFPLH